MGVASEGGVFLERSSRSVGRFTFVLGPLMRLPLCRISALASMLL